ncbi:helix-turn-helix domain-containing protein [Carboxydocella sp. ULO1]|uniref:helix-turn-helix domain-containing protein n=1 Tax=Carboxydocella sp. ULO1 TaxID=1926599 RepID=UPI0009AD0481|nr:helix-turn-helix transcriptional regulator [Carboxydocella sp. ULO1]GAW28959.1 transcriptional regulator [Carboxydocella sp. ULO1]
MFSARLKAVRKTLGLSQARLAELSGVSQAYISELEAGSKQPTLTILDKLASALGVTVAELIEDGPKDKSA